MKRMPLYYWHVENGATMLPTGNWALSYPAGQETEHVTTRESATLQDLSTMPIIDIKGRGAAGLVDLVCANDPKRLQDGQMMYTSILDDNGLIIDDGTLLKLNDEHFVSLPTSRPLILDRFRLFEPIADAVVTDVSSAYSGPIALQGPKSEEILQSITDIDLSEMHFFWGAECNVAGFPCIVDRAGYTGEDGFELFPLAEDGVEVWTAILDAGNDHGTMPLGLMGMGSLRIEKGLIGGSEYKGSNPYECRLDMFVKLRGRNFIGRDALVRIREEGVARLVVGLGVDGDDVAKAGDPILVDGVEVGNVTAATQGYFLNKNIAMGMVKSEFAGEGTKASVTTEGNEREATITAARRYDPKGERLKIKRRSG